MVKPTDRKLRYVGQHTDLSNDNLLFFGRVMLKYIFEIIVILAAPVSFHINVDIRMKWKKGAS